MTGSGVKPLNLQQSVPLLKQLAYYHSTRALLSTNYLMLLILLLSLERNSSKLRLHLLKYTLPLPHLSCPNRIQQQPKSSAPSKTMLNFYIISLINFPNMPTGAFRSILKVVLLWHKVEPKPYSTLKIQKLLNLPAQPEVTASGDQSNKVVFSMPMRQGQWYYRKRSRLKRRISKRLNK